MPDEIDVVQTHTKAKSINPKRTRAASFTTHYANQSQVTSSPFEMRLIFSEMGMGLDGVVLVEEVSSVVMSPQHAKALLYLLGANMERWEQRFGEIDMARIMPTEKVDNAGPQPEIDLPGALSPAGE